VKLTDFDADPYLFNCANGTIDLKTGKLLDHDPAHLLRKQSPVWFDPEATCPEWDKFMAHATGGDKDYLAMLQRVSGYFLTGSAEEKAFFIFYGPGDTGKTTWQETHLAMMGDYADVTPLKTILEREADASGNELVDLMGVRMAFTSEATERQKLSEGTLKALAGGSGNYRARANYKGYQTFKKTAKIALDTNEIPNYNVYDQQFDNRMIILPFDFPIVKKIGRFVEDVLSQELAGILNWSLQGCHDWMQQGLKPPARCEQKKAEIRDDKDRVKIFLNACCVQDANATIPARKLYETYSYWCFKGGFAAMNETNFGKAMGIQPKVTKGENNKGRFYKGIVFKDESPGSPKFGGKSQIALSSGHV
jgi:putative DNA primase/helicase